MRLSHIAATRLRCPASVRHLNRARSRLAVMSWAMDSKCGGITWMYPDVDPRKNVRADPPYHASYNRALTSCHGCTFAQAITTLEAIQASAQVALTLQSDHQPLRAKAHRRRALELWEFFEQVRLLDESSNLVHDNVTGTSHGKFECCNSTVKPLCEPRNSITWTYNQASLTGEPKSPPPHRDALTGASRTQGMLLGAMVDMHALTKDDKYLLLGTKVLASVVQHLTLDGHSGLTVLREPVGLSLANKQCDASHDPSAPAGGDLFSFKAVFMCVALASTIVRPPRA